MFVFRLSRREFWSSTSLALTLVLGASALATAQTPAESVEHAPPAHIAIADGDVVLDRDLDRIAATSGEPVVPGDGIRTENGRAEIWFIDGSMLALDARSAIQLQADGLVHLTAGRAVLTVSQANGGTAPVLAFRVDTPLAAVAIADAGEYSVAVSAARVDLAVVRGAADMLTDDGAMRVRSGEQTSAGEDGPPARPQRFNAARTGEFERWVAAAHDARRARATSAQYLPANLRMYGAMLDRDGSWSYEPSYGYVWYPVVDAGWRPYYRGVWRPLPGYGWTWAGADRWGWATHHYGRWGFTRSRWFWIPDRRFSPAWVSWASAPDYVGWCPLGLDNRPVVGFSLSVGDAWAAWVVMPRRSFGARDAVVSRYAYDGRRLPRSTPFALHARAPMTPPPGQRRGNTAARADVRADQRVTGLVGPRIGTGSATRADRDGDRSPTATTATATSDGWRMPLPPMAIPRGGARLDRVDRDANVASRRDGRAERSRLSSGDRAPAVDDQRGATAGGYVIVPYPTGDFPNTGARRGSRRATPSPAPPSDDRPTPMAPRNGIFVSPGVAGPRLPAAPGVGATAGPAPRGDGAGGPGGPGGHSGPSGPSGPGEPGGPGRHDGRGDGGPRRGGR